MFSLFTSISNMANDTVVLFRSLSDPSMRKGELHYSDVCEMFKVYAYYINDDLKAYAFVRKCECGAYQNKHQLLENYLVEQVPQNGVDVHANKDCQYRRNVKHTAQGKQYRLELICHCQHRDRTRRTAEYNTP